MRRQSNRLGGVFERFLWGSRLIMLVAVLTSVLLALGKLYLAVVDATRVVGILTDYADPSLGSKEATYLRNEAVASIARTIDGFLITAILLIFAFGIYELFIGDIGVIDRSEAASLPSCEHLEPAKRERGEARRPGAGDRVPRCCSKLAIRSASRSSLPSRRHPTRERRPLFDHP